MTFGELLIILVVCSACYFTGFFFGKKYGEDKVFRESIGCKVRYGDEKHETVASITFYYSEKTYEEDLQELREREERDNDKTTE